MWLNILESFFLFFEETFHQAAEVSLSPWQSLSGIIVWALSKTNWGFKMISWKDNTQFKINEFKVMINETCERKSVIAQQNTILYHLSSFQNCLLSFLFVVFSHLPTCSSCFCRWGWNLVRGKSPMQENSISPSQQHMCSCSDCGRHSAPCWHCNVWCYWLHF